MIMAKKAYYDIPLETAGFFYSAVACFLEYDYFCGWITRNGISTAMCKIVNAVYTGDYKVLITFDDGQKRLADFYGFISKSLHPSIHKYIDKTLFQQFEFDNYEIHWGTQFDIDPYDIYYGEFEAKDSPYFADIETAKAHYELVE